MPADQVAGDRPHRPAGRDARRCPSAQTVERAARPVAVRIADAFALVAAADASQRLWRPLRARLEGSAGGASGGTRHRRAQSGGSAQRS